MTDSTAYAILASGEHVGLHRIRHDHRSANGAPWGSFDWITGERVTGYGSDAAPTRATLAAAVADADAAMVAARAARSRAEDAAAGTYMGSDEWHAVDAADSAVRAAYAAYRAASAALTAHDRVSDDRAAAARYARESEANAAAYAARRPIYGQR
jgi:hypothetical protein